MKPTLPLLALSLALACAAAQATTTLSSTTAAGAGTVDSGGASSTCLSSIAVPRRPASQPRSPARRSI